MNRNVLLVDESQDLLVIWSAMLISAGFHGQHATSPQEVRSLAAAMPFCAAIIDAGLGDGDGWTLIEELASDSRTARVPVIALDEYAAPFPAMPRNVVKVLRKPVEPRLLLELVQAHCHPGAAEREA